MELSSITILGGDLRHCYTAEYLHEQGWQVVCFHTPQFPQSTGIQISDTLEQALEYSDLILLPTPLTKDGDNLLQTETIFPSIPLSEFLGKISPKHTIAAINLQKEFIRQLSGKNCQLFSLAQSSDFAAENALLTAEGLLSEIIRCTPFSLSDANILLLGYGNCGSAITRRFKPLCRSIYLLEQDLDKQEQAKVDGICPISVDDFSQILPKCQIVINTIPAPVLEATILLQLHSSCHIFDIASAPFGFPADITEKCLLPYYRLPGIPGRFSPASAGKMIGKTIERMTRHVL